MSVERKEKTLREDLGVKLHSTGVESRVEEIRECGHLSHNLGATCMCLFKSV